MRLLRIVFLVAGVAVLGWLVVRFGAGAVAASLAQVAWWQFVLICLVYGLSMAVDTFGWRYAFASDRVPLRRLFAARVAGEAVNVLTAMASVGGEAVKAWLVRRDVPYEESVPSVIVAKTAITVAQMLLLVAGITLAVTVVSIDSRLLKGMLALLLIEALAVGGFLATQVTGLVARAGRLLTAFGVAQAGMYGGRLDEALRSYYRRQWRRCLISVGWHFVGWLFSVAEAGWNQERQHARQHTDLLFVLAGNGHRDPTAAAEQDLIAAGRQPQQELEEPDPKAELRRARDHEDVEQAVRGRRPRRDGQVGAIGLNVRDRHLDRSFLDYGAVHLDPDRPRRSLEQEAARLPEI